jgi:two-component system sensor histidine kinase UhpB
MVMWQKLSLGARLNVLVAFVMVLGLGINIARLLLEAAPRVTAEDQSVVRLARGFVDTLLSDLNDAADPEARLNQIVWGLRQLRHVSITRGLDLVPLRQPAATPGSAGERQAPMWFVTLIHPEQTTVDVPIVVNGRSLGSLVITSHPTDEIAEIWDGIVTQIEVGLAISAALLLITMTVVSRALQPIQSLADAMTGIEAGRYDTRVTPSGSPEIAAICRKLNHLASVLGTSVEDKRRLAERMVSLQDAERKDIARDLHDEFGPYLFALRAHATSLTQLAAAAAPDLDILRQHVGAVFDQVNALQQFNRRVLERLRPVGLAELGLADALAALTRLWRETHPGIAIVTSISSALGDRSEMVELTIYRFIQEALTNVFRHARATRVDIRIEPARVTDALEPEAIRVSIGDNGAGLPADHRKGFGMIGMRERVMALGGSMNVESSNHGVTVEAVLPRGVDTATSAVAADPSHPNVHSEARRDFFPTG